MEGFVLVDKPKGIKSSEVGLEIGKILNAKKVGHAGTLDPGATGILVVAMDGALKFMEKLTELDKEYEGRIKFHSNIKIDQINKSRDNFMGRVRQTPPKRSAVARRERERHVYSLSFSYENEREVSFRLRCESGFYVRKLAHDLGQSIGVRAQLWELRRTGLGPFRICDCVSMDQVREKGTQCVLDLKEVIRRVST